MITKKVNRYYCEYCKRSMGHAGHMKKHEKHCTMNPNRECRMCDIVDSERIPLNELIKILPQPRRREEIINNELVQCDIANIGEIKEAFKVLRDKASNCPACILAVLRQLKIESYLVDFNFKKETDSAFSSYNDARAEEGMYQSCMY